MIGREREVAELNKLYEGKRAELVAIYGRRRVGKTYLVDETFEGRITFRHAGISPEERDDASVKESQIRHFCHSLEMAGAEMTEPADNWLDTFFLLEKHLSTSITRKPVKVLNKIF